MMPPFLTGGDGYLDNTTLTGDSGLDYAFPSKRLLGSPLVVLEFKNVKSGIKGLFNTLFGNFLKFQT